MNSRRAEGIFEQQTLDKREQIFEFSQELARFAEANDMRELAALLRRIADRSGAETKIRSRDDHS